MKAHEKAGVIGAMIELLKRRAAGEDVNQAILALTEDPESFLPGGEDLAESREGLVRQVVVDKHGVERHVWVRPDTPNSHTGGAATSTTDSSSRRAGIGPRALAVLQSVASAGSHAEHLAGAYVRDRVGRAVAKLPPRAQRVVVAAWGWTRAGFGALFTNWRIVQALAERTARKRGLSEEQARRLRGKLSTIDSKTFEVLKVSALVGVHAAHLPAMITGTLPIASTGYLAYATSTDPVATLRAATELTKETLAAGLARLPGTAAPAAAKALLRPAAAKQRPSFKPGVETFEAKQPDPAEMLADALEEHDWSDWYMALLAVALDQTGNLPDAIDLANHVAELHPLDVSSPRSDDTSWLANLAEGEEE